MSLSNNEGPVNLPIVQEKSNGVEEQEPVPAENTVGLCLGKGWEQLDNQINTTEPSQPSLLIDGILNSGELNDFPLDAWEAEALEQNTTIRATLESVCCARKINGQWVISSDELTQENLPSIVELLNQEGKNIPFPSIAPIGALSIARRLLGISRFHKSTSMDASIFRIREICILRELVSSDAFAQSQKLQAVSRGIALAHEAENLSLANLGHLGIIYQCWADFYKHCGNDALVIDCYKKSNLAFSKEKKQNNNRNNFWPKTLIELASLTKNEGASVGSRIKMLTRARAILMRHRANYIDNDTDLEKIGLTLGDLFLESGKLERAISVWRKTIAKTGISITSQLILRKIGFNLSFLHRHTEAMDAFQEVDRRWHDPKLAAYQVNSSKANFYFEWGRCLSVFFRYDDAVIKLKKALSLFDLTTGNSQIACDLALVHSDLAYASFKIGNIAYAATQYEALEAILSNLTERDRLRVSSYLLSYAEFLFEQGKYKLALEKLSLYETIRASHEFKEVDRHTSDAIKIQIPYQIEFAKGHCYGNLALSNSVEYFHLALSSFAKVWEELSGPLKENSELDDKRTYCLLRMAITCGFIGGYACVDYHHSGITVIDPNRAFMDRALDHFDEAVVYFGRLSHDSTTFQLRADEIANTAINLVVSTQKSSANSLAAPNSRPMPISVSILMALLMLKSNSVMTSHDSVQYIRRVANALHLAWSRIRDQELSENISIYSQCSPRPIHVAEIWLLSLEGRLEGLFDVVYRMQSRHLDAVNQLSELANRVDNQEVRVFCDKLQRGRLLLVRRKMLLLQASGKSSPARQGEDELQEVNAELDKLNGDLRSHEFSLRRSGLLSPQRMTNPKQDIAKSLIDYNGRTATLLLIDLPSIWQGIKTQAFSGKILTTEMIDFSRPMALLLTKEGVSVIPIPIDFGEVSTLLDAYHRESQRIAKWLADNKSNRLTHRLVFTNGDVTHCGLPGHLAGADCMTLRKELRMLMSKFWEAVEKELPSRHLDELYLVTTDTLHSMPFNLSRPANIRLRICPGLPFHPALRKVEQQKANLSSVRGWGEPSEDFPLPLAGPALEECAISKLWEPFAHRNMPEDIAEEPVGPLEFFHFAGHGSTSSFDPTQAALRLRDPYGFTEILNSKRSARLYFFPPALLVGLVMLMASRLVYRSPHCLKVQRLLLAH